MPHTRSGPAKETAHVSGRSPGSRRRNVRRASPMRGAGRLFHLFGAIAMVLGLLLPLTDAGQALASPSQPNSSLQAQSQDVSTTSFTQVAAIGDFQGQLGCNDFDINCPGTQLTNHNGLWTGTIAIPPGQWQWQIAAMTQDGQQLVLSDQGTDTNGTINLDDQDAGAWFIFNALRQKAEVAPLSQIATLATDIGTFALQPDSDDFSAIVPSQGAPINAELQLGNLPVGNPQQIQAQPGAARVTLDVSGNIIDVENLGYATLTINRVDGATGQSLSGGCYEVRDGNTVINRGCDSDDGAADGSLTLSFPEGLQDGSYTVVEVMAPDGAEQAPDKNVDLQQTDNSIEVSTGEPAEEPTATEDGGEGGIVGIPGDEETPEGEEATETPTDTADAPTEVAAPGDLIVTLQDQNNAPVGGACFQLITDGNVVAESCDTNDAFPNNGNTGFFGVPSGTYTLHQSTALDGTQPVADQEVQVPAGNEKTVIVQVPASAEPTPAPTGDLVVIRQDADGAPLGGACFELVDSNGLAVGEAVCDEDGDVTDDGRTGFFDLPVGTYTLRETRTPEGAEQAADMQTEVTDDGATQTEVRSALIPTEEPTQEPTETPTEEPTAAPTDEPTGEPTEQASPTETPTEEAVPGDLIITLQDQQGTPIGGACFELRQGEKVLGPICDSDDPFPDNGNTGFFGVPSGAYTLHQSTTPDGTQPIPDQDVTVPAGDGDTVIVKAPASAEPTAEATVTEAPDQKPIEPAAEAPPATGGNVVVDVSDVDDGQSEICVELNTTGGIGLLDVPSACNDDDAGAGSGQIVLREVPDGNYGLFVTDGPEDLVNDDPIPVTVIEGETARIALEGVAEPVPEPGILPVVVVDAQDNRVPGACWALTAEGYDSGSLCDDGENGGTAADGQVQFEGLEAGAYTLTLTTVPDGYAPVDPRSVDVVAGQNPDVEVALEIITSSITITTQNAAGDPLPGACYTINDGEPMCDGDDADGVVTINDVRPGDYTISQATAPDGYQPAADQTVNVTADTGATLIVENAPLASSVTVTTTDADGGALAGACYTLDGDEPVCDGDDADGVVQFEDVLLGEHTISQSTTPEGYKPAADQTVNVTVEGPATVTFQNIAQTGSISIELVDPDNAAVIGVCYSIDGGAQQCDDDATDANAAPGVIQVDGLSLGEHTVTLQSAPEGFELPADGMTATVEADALATIRFALSRVALTTGGLDVTVQMDTEELVPNVCVMLTNTADSSQLGPFCDEDDADTNDGSGVIGLDDVPVGAWVVSLADDTEIPGGDISNTDRPSVEVLPGQRSSALITVPTLPTTGTVRIVTTDGAVNLTGGCYDITVGDSTSSVCDNDDVDNDGTEGVIEILGVAPGTATITMTTAPGGYNSAAATDVTVVAGETVTVEITVTAIPEPGSLRITKVDDSGDALGGSCFAVTQNVTTIQSICDATDETPNDGVMVITDLRAGTYQLVETRAPSNQYQTADTQTIKIVAGEETAVEVTNVARPGRLAVITVQDADRSQRLDNACYRLESGDTVLGPFCDADDGNVDGRVNFLNMTAGDYTLVQTVAPAGYDVAGDRAVTISAGSSLQVTVANALTPPPAEAGTLAVIPLDENGVPVAGGCYQVLSGDTPVTGRVCDNADDVDKRITFENLPVGTYTVRELLAPSPAFEIAPDQEVTIRLNETTEVQFAHSLKSGRVLVQAVNSLGQPLQGACFDLKNDGQDPACTAAAGEVLFSNVPAGAESFKQTQAPAGYKLNDQTRDVTVSPGQTTVVRVVFETAPPPDSGSVQVQKFICPAGEGGERTQFLGGAQGNAELAKTAGCVQGEAAFTLVADDGSGSGPGVFSTGSDGRYQVTVKRGLYVLTETDPDLPGSSAARLRVGVGQMTTVIVINYVAPPKPVPTNIDVTSYTCPPSFNGTSYTDFAESCMGNQALTNNLTVRAEGASKFKQVTGDQGKLGTTTFENLPAGKYTVYGDKPYNIPIMYVFCGTNADAPTDVKAINGTVPVSLESGQTITCDFFLVPEQLSKDTGGILVHKFSCPIDKPAKGYDWANECERSSEQVAFSIDIFNKEMQDFEPIKEVTANPDGLVRFTILDLGTYKLQEVGAKWCFAQSNSVNADGNVVVQPNRLSEVWIYNCVGTSQPPNTGSGDAAALLNPVGEGNTGAMVLLNLAWPAVALMVWFGWRSRHPNHSPVIVRRGSDRAA